MGPFFFVNTDFLFPFTTKWPRRFHWKILSTYIYQIFLPENLIQIAQESLQDLLTAEATFPFRRLSSFKPNNHVTLVVINSRVTRPHPYFTCKSPYTVNLMKFLGPKPAFELTNNFPRSTHLDRVYGSVFVRGKFWNKSDVPVFEDCKRDSNNDVLSGYNFPVLILQKNSSASI